MRDITILHIYSDTLDLYGDFFNVTCIKNRIEEMGLNCQIIRANLDEFIPVDKADFIYIGHGKARNLCAVANHFYEFKDKILSAIESGKVFFVSGNARLLFGKNFDDENGNVYNGIGLFDYVGKETGKVFTSDVFAKCEFDNTIQTYGFINRTQHIVGENKCPLFELEVGAGDGEKATKVEGNHYKNYFGTWQMGPFLARNPKVLKYLLKQILGDDMGEYDDSLEITALEKTLNEKE